ncbi:DUF1249 family protein [Vibrio breoganii]|uniref:DUF1249 family protein n=1 Tax=Vibrio breoganii TaxID=553239 RepID=A0AAJ3SFF2_9VIBR|nr:DUF1249 family protein [Vibrio breoganii]ANO32048.1 dehydrogenase [Vibrio breoganii]MDN3716361.1 DUF1249 family protein [Vibrio breoganii]NMO72583.1 DUF1249 family protein [Vibrio breoganii]NMR69183.1 DUF1249 family protein [Vibrio breoganii]OCH73076.1 dehydrogenase [Vibrio breoganii]
MGSSRLVGSNYHVDFAGLMRLYETNYAKLNALLPRQPEVGNKRTYQVQSQIYQINVLEITRYTTLVDVFQCDEAPTFPLPHMTVRLYHDARVAEVCASEKMRVIHARYDYPNKKMMQKDEKHQLNQFLGDWLTFCLKMGISREPLL